MLRLGSAEIRSSGSIERMVDKTGVLLSRLFPCPLFGIGFDEKLSCPMSEEDQVKVRWMIARLYLVPKAAKRLTGIEAVQAQPSCLVKSFDSLDFRRPVDRGILNS